MSNYTVEDADSSCRNLHHRLDVMCELQFGLALGDRDTRVDSLLWIARDISDGIVYHLDEAGEAAMAKAIGEQQIGEGAR